MNTSVLRHSLMALALTVSPWVNLAYSQTLYVVDGVVGSTNQIQKIDAAGTTTPVSTGFNQPRALLRDSDGSLFLVENGSAAGNGRVTKIAANGATTVIANGFTGGFGLAMDAGKNLFVGNDTATPLYAVNTVIKFPAGSGLGSVFASGFSSPRGLAFDTAGNLFVANFGNGTISKVTPGGATSSFATGLSGPWGLAFDAAGNLYAANRTGRTISKITADGTLSTFASVGPARPQGLAFDAAGVLYVSFSNGTVGKVDTAGTLTALYSPSLDITTPDFFSLAIDRSTTQQTSGIEAWRSSNFGANSTNPAVAGDLADPDLDGLSNLLEYALGTDPKTSSKLGLPTGTYANGSFSYTYQKNASATDISLTVEVAEALPVFSAPSGFTSQSLGTAAGVETLRLTFPTSVKAAQYVRLRVARN